MKPSRGMKIVVAALIVVACATFARAYYVTVDAKSDARRIASLRHIASGRSSLPRELRGIQIEIGRIAGIYKEPGIALQSKRALLALFVFESSLFRAERAAEALATGTSATREQAHKEFHWAIDALEHDKRAMFAEIDRLTAFIRAFENTPRGQST